MRAPRRIPEWVMSREEKHELYAAGHGTAPDLIYASGVPDSPLLDPSSFNKKLCTLIIIEISFCRELGCVTKLEAKTKKYSSLVKALERHWGRFGWNLSPYPYDTAAPPSRRLSPTSPPHSPPFDREWSPHEPAGRATPPTRTTTRRPTTISYSSRCWTPSRI